MFVARNCLRGTQARSAAQTLHRMFGETPKPKTQPSPFNIKPEYKLLKDGSYSAVAKLVDKNIQGSYCFIKLELPDKEKVLGNQIGQSVKLSPQSSKQEVWRHYCPISRVDEQGVADFLVKFVESVGDSKKDSGEFSQLLREAKVGDQFNVRGPYTKWIYEGFGKFKFDKDLIVKSIQIEGVPTEASKKGPAATASTAKPTATAVTTTLDSPSSSLVTPIERDFDTVVMIAHDSAITAQTHKAYTSLFITAFFSLIDMVSNFKHDRTSLVLIHCVDKVEDIILEEALQEYQKAGRLHVRLFIPPGSNPVLESVEGKINFSEVLADSVPEGGLERVGFLICGNKKFASTTKTHIESLVKLRGGQTFIKPDEESVNSSNILLV